MAATEVDVAGLRAGIEERLAFAARTVGEDGALVAYHAHGVDALWSAARNPGELVARAAVLAQFDADLLANRGGFDYGQRAIHAGGGSGLFLIHHGRAPALAFALDDAFRARTGGMNLTTAWVPFDPDARPDIASTALDRLRRALDLGRDLAEPPDLPLDFSAGAGEPDPEMGPPMTGALGVVLAGGCGLWRLAGKVTRAADLSALYTVFGAQLAAAARAAAAEVGGVTVACLGACRLWAVAPAADALAFAGALARALEAEIDDARWTLRLEDKLQTAYGELGATLGVALGPASAGLGGLARTARALLPTAHRLRAADDQVRSVAAVGVITADTALVDGVPASAQAVDLSRWDEGEPGFDALNAAAARAASAPPHALPWLRRAAPVSAALAAADAQAQAEGAERLEEPLATPLASWVRASVAEDPALRAWLASEAGDPNGILRALPAPGALDLALLLAAEGGR